MAALGGPVAVPEFFRGGKLVERDLPRHGATGGRAVVFEEGVAVGTVGERDIEDLGVFERLLHAAAHRVVVVFGLDDAEREVRAVKEEVIGLLCLPSLDGLAADQDPALREIDLLADLVEHIPLRSTRPGDGGRDELGADVRLVEVLFVHARFLRAIDQRPLRVP